MSSFTELDQKSTSKSGDLDLSALKWLFSKLWRVIGEDFTVFLLACKVSPPCPINFSCSVQNIIKLLFIFTCAYIISLFYALFYTQLSEVWAIFCLFLIALWPETTPLLFVIVLFLPTFFHSCFRACRNHYLDCSLPLEVAKCIGKHFLNF